VPSSTAKGADSASGRTARAAAIPSAIDRSTAWMIPPTVTCWSASRPAKAASWPTGGHCPSLQPTSARNACAHAAPPSSAAARSRARASEPGMAKTRIPDNPAGPTTVVSLPSHRATRARQSGPRGDSRASRSAPSSTTPAAPAAKHPAATAPPIPPRTQTGTPPAARAACKSTNEDSAPQRPPAS